MKHAILFLIAILSVAVNAEVLNFDDVTTGDFAILPAGYGGFTWDAVGAVHESVYPDSGYNAGVVSGEYVGFNVLGETATVTGPVFDFNGVYLTAAWREGLNIRVSGYFEGALLYETTVVVDLYEPTWFDFNYAGVDELVFESFGGTDVLPSPYIGPHFAMDDFTFNEIIEPPTGPITVDIIPGACPNKVNVKSKGLLQVVVAGSAETDVYNIDMTSLEILGLVPKKSSYDDVTSPSASGQDCDCATGAPDGFTDLILKFDRQAVIGVLGPVEDGDQIILTLTGSLLDSTAIEGWDCILIMKKSRP